MRYLIPALHDLGEMLKGRRLAPIEFYEAVWQIHRRRWLLGTFSPQVYWPS